MKIIRKIGVIFICLTIYVYICNIALLPSDIIVFKGEDVQIRALAGLKIRKEKDVNFDYIQASQNYTEGEATYSTAGSYEINLDLFGTIPVKEINVNVIERTKVIPCGNLIGVKMNAHGALVVGFSEIMGADNSVHKPFENSGIKEGDSIVEINGRKITNTNELIAQVDKSQGEKIEIKYERNGMQNTATISPVKCNNKEFKIGLWVRDATAGVGTLTFVEPTTGNFAALGHGIIDVDTGGIFNIANGQLVTSKIVSIKKGEKNNPGEIHGLVNLSDAIGDILKNTNFGVFGKVENINKYKSKEYKECEIALRSEIKEGEAELICELENDVKKSYKIKIEKIYTSNNYDNKSMRIKIVDEQLLNKTGGIIQGMSGSPIIQNGKFIGAVTNVLVSDPTTGYAIFGDLMIKQMRAS